MVPTASLTSMEHGLLPQMDGRSYYALPFEDHIIAYTIITYT